MLSSTEALIFILKGGKKSNFNPGLQIIKYYKEEETMGDQRNFIDFCADGDIEAVQAAIDNGADVNEDMYGTTGLMWALAMGYNNHVVQLLLQHPEINANLVVLDGYSALHEAIMHDNPEGMATLLAHQHERGISTINQTRSSGYQRDDDSWTPIMFAVGYNAVNCFQLLLTNPLVDLDVMEDYRTTQEVRG